MKKVVVIGLSGESVFLSCDHFNKLGETVQAKSIMREPGGKGYNQALALGKIGADVSFITALGNDSYVKTCLEVLNKNNVKVYPIYKNINSSYAVITTDKNGENNVLVYHGASDLVTFDDIMEYRDVIKKADVILLQLEYPFEVICKVIEYAYSIGIDVVLNPAPTHNLSQEIIDKVDIITPNEFELLHMCNSFDINEAMNKIVGTTIVCTRGSKDIYIKENGKINTLKINHVQAIDTTGAGDIFNAFLVYFLYYIESNVFKACEFARVASGISVLHKGVCNAIPTIDEVKRMVNNE